MAGLAFILDMDGVIVDSNPWHCQAWSCYNRRFGIETDEAMHMRMFGKRNDEIVRDFFGPDLTFEEIRAHGAAKERLYRELIGGHLETSLVPGVREFLEEHAGVPAGLATNAEPANVDFLLDAAGLRAHFDAIVDGSQVDKPKPHPEIYLKAAAMLGADPRNCIVFEDSLAGIAAAGAAGARTVGLTTTHARLPGVRLTIGSFRDPALKPWLAGQTPR